jgi:hypothetical protein
MPRTDLPDRGLEPDQIRAAPVTARCRDEWLVVDEPAAVVAQHATDAFRAQPAIHREIVGDMGAVADFALSLQLRADATAPRAADRARADLAGEFEPRAAFRSFSLG